MDITCFGQVAVRASGFIRRPCRRRPVRLVDGRAYCAQHAAQAEAQVAALIRAERLPKGQAIA